jgi:hypothetical protein
MPMKEAAKNEGLNARNPEIKGEHFTCVIITILEVYMVHAFIHQSFSLQIELLAVA